MRLNCQFYAHGSPPRAWGSQPKALSHTLRPRFTPTCVGITPENRIVKSFLSVHPHVRGDHKARTVIYLDRGGSPPRAWGSQPEAVPVSQHPRFTPTCVGITPTMRLMPFGPAVHPHVRGDHAKEFKGRGWVDGSPPRAWGSLRRLCECRVAHRFTPTCVGITPCAWGSRTAKSVHPHVRGDHTANSAF